MENIINRAVLFDYFSGRVSPLQKKTIEYWLADANNRELYYQWLHEWELSGLQTSVDWQDAFGQTVRRVNGPDLTDADPETPLTTWWHRDRWMRWPGQAWLVAASLTLLLGTGSWFYRDRLLYQTVRTGFGETRSLILPDGSGVTLNANSSLRYPRWFASTRSVGRWLQVNVPGATALEKQPGRTVLLTGEADFSVRHLPDHQRFVVMTPAGLTVRVLGTQFSVFSRERGTRVALRSGRVELTLAQRVGERPVAMRPGDLATLNGNGQLALRRVAHPEVLTAWKQHRFTFEQTSLGEIAQLLRENYGLAVSISDASLAARTISGSFPARDANEVLKLVAELLQINYIRDNNTVTFTD